MIVLLYLMNCSECPSKILGCYFCYINWYLIHKGSYVFVFLEWLNIIRTAIITYSTVTQLPHKIEGQSHILPTVFQHKATKQPSKNTKFQTSTTELEENPWDEDIQLIESQWFSRSGSSVLTPYYIHYFIVLIIPGPV